MTNHIQYIGVNDHEIDLFEGQYIVPNGMAYNSYLILDDKIAVMDSVDGRFASQWLENMETALNGKTPDYIVIQHMEPDHASGLAAFMEKYPSTIVVGNQKTFGMVQAFFEGIVLDNRMLTVKEGDKLSLGTHELTFIFAPMVHWPEVMVTYESAEKILFSADAFGKFGALDVEEEWACEARRYYFGIVGKYGVQVQALLKKTSALEIETICPLHGPVLSENLGYYLNLYQTWSSYGVETDGAMIAYTSIYGNTKKAVELLAALLNEKGCPRVVVCDLAREDMAEAVEDAFRHGKLVLATTTYNNDIFPFMRTFIDHLVERNYQKRTVALMENGSWAPAANKVMASMFEKSKDITILDTRVTIKSALNDASRAQIAQLAEELV